MRSLSVHAISIIAIAITLSACSSRAPWMSSVPTGNAGGANTIHSIDQGWVSKEAKTASLMYVGDNNCDCIHEYVQSSGALVGLITAGIAGPSGLATDSAGNLWVSNNNSQTVTAYAPGETFPFKSLSDTQFPYDVVVDDDGTVFVANSQPTPSVFVYANGSTTPTSMLFDAQASFGGPITIDKKGNLYWALSAKNQSVVDEFVKGKGKPIRTGIAVTQATFLKFSGGDELIISDAALPAIQVFALPNDFVRQFGESGTPYGIGLNPFDKLFVADHFSHKIEVYDFANGTLLKTYPTGSFYPTGLALFPRQPLRY